MQFDTAQAAFLAGYLAAGYSKTGKVATYGGLKIPPVTIFMDGFADGVAHYNTGQEQERPGARLGQGHADTAPFAETLHRPGQGQGGLATRSSPRAPT